MPGPRPSSSPSDCDEALETLLAEDGEEGELTPLETELELAEETTDDVLDELAALETLLADDAGEETELTLLELEEECSPPKKRSNQEPSSSREEEEEEDTLEALVMAAEEAEEAERAEDADDSSPPKRRRKNDGRSSSSPVAGSSAGTGAAGEVGAVARGEGLKIRESRPAPPEGVSASTIAGSGA